MLPSMPFLLTPCKTGQDEAKDKEEDILKEKDIEKEKESEKDKLDNEQDNNLEVNDSPEDEVKDKKVSFFLFYIRYIIIIIKSLFLH